MSLKMPDRVKQIYRSDLELTKREFPTAYADLTKKVEHGNLVIVENF